MGFGKGKHAIDDHFLIARGSLLVGLTESGDDHLGLGGIELFAEGLKSWLRFFSYMAE